MKKILILILVVLLVSGCVNINDSSYEKIIKETTNSKTKIYNVHRKGYKYYLPKDVYITDYKEYNEILKTDNETFYLYFDLVSYLNKTPVEYEEEECEYFKEISNNDLTGYLKIKLYKKHKYLIEIAYNYAKIEVIVEKDRAKNAITDAMVILSSIKYNKSFLQSLDKESLLNYNEEEVDIFKKPGDTSGSNKLEWEGTYDPDYDKEEIPDFDLIN